MEPIGPHGTLAADMTTDGVVVLTDAARGQKVSMTEGEAEGFVRWLATARGLDRREVRPQDAVLVAARRLLDARRADMLTVEEAVALARAVAACVGGRTADLLTGRDLEQVAEYGVPWDETVDGPLPTEDE
jgi:hypothetical protein